MRYRSKVNRTLIIIILSLFILNISARLLVNMYKKHCENQNQKLIDTAVNLLSYSQNLIDYDIGLLTPLLENKNLSERQIGQIYLLITTLHYTAGDMKSYFDNVGKALFYCIRSKNVDEVIYLYADMAKYFMEIGADKEAYEIINQAASFGSFFECKNILSRIQALLVYSNYLISIKDYDKALFASYQVIDDAHQTIRFNQDFPLYYERSGNVIKALILLSQQKYNEAYVMACELYEKYSREDEVVSQFSAFDFYMPIFYIKTIWAIHEGDYEKALEFNKEYGKFCDDFFFSVKKIQLTSTLIAALPPQMSVERKQLIDVISVASRTSMQSLTGDYTYLVMDKFSSVMNELALKAEINEQAHEKLRTILANIFIVFIALILFYAVFNEAQLDGLTKLSSRRALNAKLRQLEFMKKTYSAIMLDLDDFKILNDTYGHAFGDEVLKKVSGVILDQERRFVRAYRYGGEEIVILFEHTAFEDIIRHSESLRTKICRLSFSNDARVTASFGIGSKPENPLQQADENLYYAKSKGKNIVAYKINNRQYLAERRLEIRNPMPDTKKASLT